MWRSERSEVLYGRLVCHNVRATSGRMTTDVKSEMAMDLDELRCASASGRDLISWKWNSRRMVEQSKDFSLKHSSPHLGPPAFLLFKPSHLN